MGAASADPQADKRRQDRGKPMDNAKNLFGYESLAFFGRVNASISHELKNIMAIISETAGLLEDLSEMASAGGAIAPDMLENCTGSIVEEIQRGFSVIRQMNRFAHSVDTPSASVNLMDLLELAINLSRYLSHCGKTMLHPCQGEEPVVSTAPFLLQAIFYQALVHTFKRTGPDAQIEISILSLGDSGWRVTFSGFTTDAFQVFPDADTKRLAASIGVAIHCDTTADRLAMDVPLGVGSATDRREVLSEPSPGTMHR
jgi:signal transduction histidine kinase